MADVIVANTSPGIAGKTLACHDADGVTTGLWTVATPLALKNGVAGSQTWRESVDGAGTLNVLADGTGRGLSVTPAGDLTEKGRITPLGHWIDVPFDAANFTASAGTWTIGNVVTNAYTLIGKTLVYLLAVGGCGISASPQSLAMTLPAGLTTAKFGTGVLFYGNSTLGTGIVYVNPSGGNKLYFLRDVGSTPWVVDSAATFYASITVPLV